MINTLKHNGGNVEANLSLYQFKDDGVYIMYCPALDLSGYGASRKESRASFEVVLSEYLDYCIKNNTLRADLEKHGWKLDGGVEAPSVKKMLHGNKTLENIIYGADYVKTSRTVGIPVLA